jgi:hypothetical protein
LAPIAVSPAELRMAAQIDHVAVEMRRFSTRTTSHSSSIVSSA